MIYADDYLYDNCITNGILKEKKALVNVLIREENRTKSDIVLFLERKKQLYKNLIDDNKKFIKSLQTVHILRLL